MKTAKVFALLNKVHVLSHTSSGSRSNENAKGFEPPCVSPLDILYTGTF